MGQNLDKSASFETLIDIELLIEDAGSGYFRIVQYEGPDEVIKGISRFWKFNCFVISFKSCTTRPVIC